MIDGFESRISPEPNSGCWLWTGAVRKDCRRKNYTTPRIKRNGKGVAAYRAVYELCKGPIPSGMLVCHKCDTPMCVNPAHLWLGTNAENMADMLSKGRKVVSPRHGDLNPNAKLTAAQVISIRRDARSRLLIAMNYGVSVATIRDIKSGRRWTGVQ